MSDRMRAGTEVASASTSDLDVLTALAAPQFEQQIANVAVGFGVRYAAIVFADDRGLWFQSRTGFPDAVTPREGPLWDAILSADSSFYVQDLLDDPRFAPGPHLIGGTPVRMVATCVVRSQEGNPIGALCLADPDPVELDEAKRIGITGVVSYIETELAALEELDRAAEVQRELLPKSVPPLPGYQVAGMCLPARYVGGDFFDWYDIEGGMAFTLADVMGKGVGAGIIAATVRATVRTARDDDVVVAIDRAAEALDEDLSEAGSFVTLFHARLSAADGRVSYVDAGHGLTVLLDAEGSVRRLSSHDLPLGTSFGIGCTPQEIVLERGGILVSVSDGVLDLYDGTLASLDRLADIARAAPSAASIVDEIERLARRDRAPDDVTVVAIRREN